ncbi:uncharacterized protein yc1106_07985 [Curvularia clavata]|uniref:Coenzyme Q-binding protein COQ10 START domain-containing protein n=1 Tax=Curvularia clavata TaxID=95742 RepID=A0A9Q8ZCJ4_CURCL|nr:uncharacterized protein yc1106_07985 [Curvularia clavata]
MTTDKPWPPSTGLATVVIPRGKATLETPYSIVVHAPASLVFDTVLRIADYPAWNTWVPAGRILTHPPPAPGAEDEDPNDLSRMRVGSTMEFEVIMDASKPNDIHRTPLKVMDISTPAAPSSYVSPELLEDPSFTADLSKVYRVAWKGNGGMMGLAPTCERFHEVIVISDNECEVRSWELMSGVTAKIVKAMYENTLKEKVALWCTDLKRYCEQKHAQASSAT